MKQKKRITPGTGSRTTSRDPTLDIDISDKNLTDAGFDEFIAALQECMSFRDAEHPDGAAKVTELHLRGNGLTVRSLEKLTDVIELSCSDLRELDLSNNCIDIADGGDDEVKGLWLRFLRAFEGCFVLKKVDFGGNRLGLAGVEMLARAYMQSELDFFEGEVSDNGVGSVGDEIEDVDRLAAVKMNGHKENDAAGRGGRSKKSPSKVKAKQNGEPYLPPPIWCLGLTCLGMIISGASKAVSPADLRRFACTRGLRSVPFIILANTSLTTGAAIHLASMILVHRSPDHLLPYLPSSKTPDTDTTRCNGLIWLPNDNLTDLGHKMLDAAETLRAFTADMDPEEDQLHREGKLPRDLDGVNLVGLMEQRRQHAKLNVEFTRVAKRARIEAMRTERVHGAEIWGVALRMVTLTRTLLMDGSKRDVEEQSGSEGEHDVAAPAAAAAAEVAPGPEKVQNGELAPLDSIPSNEMLPAMTSAMAHIQTVPAANHHVNHINNRKYVPFDYRAIEDEPLLPTYPITATQTIYTQPSNENTPFDLPSVKEPYPSDDTSIVYPMVNRNDYVPSGYGPQQGYEYAQTDPPEYDRMPMYSDASMFNDPAPARPGPFQPGAVAFEANFPVLGKLSDKELAAQQAKEMPVTPSQPKRRQRQRKSQSHTQNHSKGPSNGQSPSQTSPRSPRHSQTNGTNPNEPGKTNGHQKKREVQNWFAELPLHLTRRIIAYTAGANGVLSQAQQEGVMRYALDWKSVAAELRAQGAEEHQQIWKLVDAVECFTYSSLS